LRSGLRQLAARELGDVRIPVDDAAIRGLKFADMRPRALAADTLSRRLADMEGAQTVARRSIIDRVDR